MQGAETRLKAEPTLWQKLLRRQQTPQMLEAFNVVADYMIDNTIFFFRNRIESAFHSPDTLRRCSAHPACKNDTIYEQLADRFTTEEAYDTSISVRGFEVTKGRVCTMLSRWESKDGRATRPGSL